jgi:hypothetical protein
MPALLAGDGFIGLLKYALEAQDELDLPDTGIYKSARTLSENLSERGLEVLEEAVEYQLSHGYSTNELFINFASFAERIDVELPADERESAWSALEDLFGGLKTEDTTLGYVNPETLSSYQNSEEKAVELKGVIRHSRALNNLRLDSEVNSLNQSRIDRFVDGLATLGASSGAISVVRDLIDSSKGGEALTIVEIADSLWGEPFTEQAWSTVGEHLEFYRSAGFPLQSLIRKVQEIDAQNNPFTDGDPLLWKHFSEVAEDLQSGDLPLDVISPRFLEEYGKNSERNQVLLGLFSRAVARFGEQIRHTEGEGRIPSELTRLLAEMTSKNFGLTDNPAMVHKLNLMVAGAGYQTIEEFRTGLKELKMYALTDIMLNAPDPERQKWARETISREFNMGGPPYELGSPEAKQHYNQSMEVVLRAFRDNKGFGGLAIDCRGVPSSEELDTVPSMMIRFGEDSAQEVYIANASSNQHYPGKGVHIAGMEPEKVFAPDPGWEERGKDSPFWQWTEGKGLFAGEYFHNFDMEDFRNAEFLLLRGVMAVMNPGNEKFDLDGVNYSYVVFNRHFYPGTEAACLVPTEVLQEQLADGLARLESYRGFDTTRTDLSEDRLSYRALLEACQGKGLNLLNLTYGSVIGGGLCNAYLPGSAPHYEWEDGFTSVSAWQDSWGHVHKSWLLMRDFSMDRGRQIDSKLSFAREAQENVYNVSRGLQSELDALRFALSFYKMGSTLTRDQFRDNPDGSGGQDEEQFMDDNQQEQPQFDEQTVHDYRYRMLEEIYRWHLGAVEAGWSVGQIPVLHFAYVLEPNLLPPKAERQFELDLADMKLVTPDGEFYLPLDGDGLGEEEREIWRKHVIPYFQDGTGYEPRLLMRDGAYSLFE